MKSNKKQVLVRINGVQWALFISIRAAYDELLKNGFILSSYRNELRHFEGVKSYTMMMAENTNRNVYEVQIELFELKRKYTINHIKF